MRIAGFMIVITITSIKCFSQAGTTFPSKDLAQLMSLPAKWEKYWNAHNMDSTGTMLREDVDFVNLAGVWLKGKAAIVSQLGRFHQTTFKSSVWGTDSVALKYVKPDLAILHIAWSLSGDVDPDGTPRKPRHGIFTWFVIKENGQWLLFTMDNVIIIERVSPSK